MKALLLVDEPNDKIAIGQIGQSTLKPNQVLVKVKAAALNHRDQWCRMGMYPNLKYDTVLGSDGAGVVDQVGNEVDSLWLGKAVMMNPNINWGENEAYQSKEYHILGMPTNGTFSEYVVVDQDRLIIKPKYLSFEQAAAIPLGGLTAFRAVFTKGQIKKDQNVLVTGIGGGVAQFAFQFAKAAGANVFVTSGNADKIKKAVGLGAKAGFSYKEQSWAKAAMKSTGGFDVIIDSAGGQHVSDYMKVLRPGGRLVHYGATAGKAKDIDLFKVFWNQVSILGTSMGSDNEFMAMVTFCDQHQIIPIIDSVRPFDEIVSAFDDMHAGTQFGKLVVTMNT